VDSSLPFSSCVPGHCTQLHGARQGAWLTNITRQSKIAAEMSTEISPSAGKRPSWHLARRYPLEVLWRSLTAPGTVRMWLACLLVATILGALFPQAPLEVSDSPVSYQQWLATVRPLYGSWGEFLERAGLLNLRAVLWYRGLWSLAVCSLLLVGWEQIGPRWRAYRTLPSVDGLSSLLPDVSEVELQSTMSPEQVTEAMSSLLLGKGYRVRCDPTSDGGGWLTAQKGRSAWLGPVALHGGLLALLLAIVVNQHWGWRDGPFSLAVGSTHDLRRDGGLSLRYEGASERSGAEGSSESLRGVLTLWREQETGRRLLVRSGVPTLHRGLLVYQLAMGPAVRVTLNDAAGDSVALESLDQGGGARREILALLAEGQDETWIGAPSQGIALYIARDDSAQALARDGPVLHFQAYRGDEVEPAVDRSVAGIVSLELDGATCHLAVESFASILIVRRPGLPISAAGVLLAMAGLCTTRISFPRCVWLAIERGRRRGSRVRVAVGGRRRALWAGPLLDGVRLVLEASTSLEETR
jgi:hypothetical protein